MREVFRSPAAATFAACSALAMLLTLAALGLLALTA